MIQAESLPGSYGKLAGSNSLSHFGMAKPLTHGQQVTLLRTEASTAFTAKMVGKKAPLKGRQNMKGMMNWVKAKSINEGSGLSWSLEQHSCPQV